MSARPVRLALAAALAMIAGCAATPKAAAPARPGDGTDSRFRITVGGDGLDLGETHHAALRPEELARVVGELLTAQRFQTARRWVLRYPDVALEFLRNGAAEDASNPAVPFIASQHDLQCEPAAIGTGWVAVLKDRRAHPAAHRLFQDRRAQVLAGLRVGRLGKAAGVRLLAAVPTTTPGVLLKVEALRLHGLALLLHENWGEAADAFTEASKLAQVGSPYQAAQLLLFSSDAHRRAGQKDAATAEWKNAITLAASRLTSKGFAINDPIFWERAVHLRPQTSPWPPELIPPLADALTHNPTHVWQSDPRATVGSANADAVERLLWSNIGVWHLGRQEAPSALVAFQRAQALAESDTQREELRLQQARAMAKLGQRAAAMSLLAGLMDKPTAIGHSALAAAGVLRIEQDQVTRGLRLLEQAVDFDQNKRWPGRLQAQSDLGSAYLIVGNEDNGFAYLNRAKREAAATRDTELLIALLQNELRYDAIFIKSGIDAVRKELHDAQRLNQQSTSE